MLSHFGQRLIDLKVKIKTLTYWAGACTIDLFKQTLMPAVNKGTIEKFTCFNLSGDTELDDSLYGIYNKSLLYLVAHAFEDSPRIPLTPNKGTPLLGMDKFVSRDAELNTLFKAKNNSYVLAPNQEPPGHRNASKSKHHGDFDDDINTVQATIARILEK